MILETLRPQRFVKAAIQVLNISDFMNSNRPHRNAAILLMAIFLLAVNSVNLFALCISGTHQRGVAIEFMVHNDTGNDFCICEKGIEPTQCIDLPLSSPTNYTQNADFSQAPLPVWTIFDPEISAVSFNRRNVFDIQSPVPSTPLFIENQSFLN